RLVGGRLLAAVLAERELERELAPGHLVERVTQHRRVLRLLRLLPVEDGVGRKLERQHLAVESRGARLREERAGGDRALLDGGHYGTLPRLLQLLQFE